MYSVPYQIYAEMDQERSTRAGSKTSWNPQDRGRSLVSMRTFYAFGARSSSIGGRSASVVPSSIPAHYNPPGYSHRFYPSPVVADSPFTRNSASRATISSSYIRPSPTVAYRSSYTPMRSPSYSRITTPHRAFSPVEKMRPVSRTIASPVYSERIPRKEAAESRNTVLESRPHSVLDTIGTPTVATPVPTVDEKSLVELDELRNRNRALEEELARLLLKVKDGDKSNIELKRRLLESEAEAKVWRTKAEHVPEPQIIEVMRPAKHDVVMHHHAIDETLYDKLETTADKLTKLNAVNDLKLLQSHIESALTEITSK